MDLPGGRNLCGQHSGKKYSHHVCLDKVVSICLLLSLGCSVICCIQVNFVFKLIKALQNLKAETWC